MTKLHFDKDYLTQIVKPSLENGIDTISDAIYNTSIRIPNDFQYFNYLMNVKNVANKSLTKLKGTKDWLNKASTKIESEMSYIEELTNSLEEVKTITEKSPSVITL